MRDMDEMNISKREIFERMELVGEKLDSLREEVEELAGMIVDCACDVRGDIVLDGMEERVKVIEYRDRLLGISNPAVLQPLDFFGQNDALSALEWQMKSIVEAFDAVPAFMMWSSALHKQFCEDLVIRVGRMQVEDEEAKQWLKDFVEDACTIGLLFPEGVPVTPEQALEKMVDYGVPLTEEQMALFLKY